MFKFRSRCFKRRYALPSPARASSSRTKIVVSDLKNVFFWARTKNGILSKKILFEQAASFLVAKQRKGLPYGAR